MGSFDGLADIYEEARRRYPLELRDHLVELQVLTPEVDVIDLGAGTGQLATLLARVARRVTAIDPEPDMVRAGVEATESIDGIQWLIGADRDLLSIIDRPIDLVVIGNAFHHMAQRELLADLDLLLRPSGAVVICSSSVPVWLQDADWSRALRAGLSAELGREVSSGGTPDHESDRAVLEASAFSAIEEWVFERDHPRSLQSIVGEVVSSASGAIDDAAASRLVELLVGHATDGAIGEHVKTTALVARRPLG